METVRLPRGSLLEIQLVTDGEYECAGDRAGSLFGSRGAGEEEEQGKGRGE